MSLFKKFKSIMPHVTVLTAEDIIDINKYALKGNLELMHNIFSQKKFKIIPLPINNIFGYAFAGENLNIIEYLLTSENTKEFHNTNLNNFFIAACSVRKPTFIESIFNSRIIRKCITTPNLENHALNSAASRTNLEVINFLICEPRFKENLNLNINDDILFKKLFLANQKDMLEYLINDLNIPFTNHIKNLLINSHPDKKPQFYGKLFEMRNLKNDLEAVPDVNLGKPKKRIKI